MQEYQNDHEIQHQKNDNEQSIIEDETVQDDIK